jgi:hypothetical protein
MNELLKTIIDRYLKSGDFNGYYVDGSVPQDVRENAKQLIRTGFVQVVAEDVDYLAFPPIHRAAARINRPAVSRDLWGLSLSNRSSA